MPIITLLTDFGVADEYAGVMKGVMLSIHPEVKIVDISHEISPQNIDQAAFMLASYYKFFPEGAIHVVVVDPDVGTERGIILLQKSGRLFLAPDNGVLTLLLEDGSIDAATRVENETYYLKRVSRTFHGRDIFAPVAAHLSRGLSADRLGREINPEKLVRRSTIRPAIAGPGEIRGHIIHIDRFGNLMTNIDAETIGKISLQNRVSDVVIKVAGQKILKLSACYGTDESGRPLALVNSRGYLEIAVNGGSARDYFHMNIGDPVTVTVGK